MKRQILVLAACMVVLAHVLLAAGCTSPSSSPVTTTTVTPETPAFTPSASSCGFTTCHGLNLACGMSEPRSCTMEYQLGDKCRQYAECVPGSDGTCSLVTSPAFDTCRSCVKSCSQMAKSDPVSAFDCEAKC